MQHGELQRKEKDGLRKRLEEGGSSVALSSCPAPSAAPCPHAGPPLTRRGTEGRVTPDPHPGAVRVQLAPCPGGDSAVAPAKES